MTLLASRCIFILNFTTWPRPFCATTTISKHACPSRLRTKSVNRDRQRLHRKHKPDEFNAYLVREQRVPRVSDVGLHLSHGIHQLVHHLDRNNVVFGAHVAPGRQVLKGRDANAGYSRLELRSCLASHLYKDPPSGITASANGKNGSEKVRLGESKRPGAAAAHRQSGQVNSAFVNLPLVALEHFLHKSPKRSNGPSCVVPLHNTILVDGVLVLRRDREERLGNKPDGSRIRQARRIVKVRRRRNSTFALAIVRQHGRNAVLFQQFQRICRLGVGLGTQVATVQEEKLM